MTFVCTTLRQVQAVLMVLAGVDSFVVLLVRPPQTLHGTLPKAHRPIGAPAVPRLRSMHTHSLMTWQIKNRLMLEFDASATGGYRDMLLNLLCKATGHIVEVQITLSKLIAVKASGGHASYAIARVHELFEKATFRHEGALSPKLITAVRCGIVRELVCTGTAVGLSVHFDGLLEALRAPSCGLRELRLVGCDWPEGRGLSELADALPVGRLKILNVENMQVGSALPATLMDKCTEVELLDLCALGLTGGVPASIGKCAKLKKLYLWGNQLEGPIPDEIGQCEDLEDFPEQAEAACRRAGKCAKQEAKLTGGVPASIDGRRAGHRQVRQAEELYLFSNQLEGPIPDEIGQCEDLEDLHLSREQADGRRAGEHRQVRQAEATLPVQQPARGAHPRRDRAVRGLGGSTAAPEQADGRRAGEHWQVRQAEDTLPLQQPARRGPASEPASIGKCVQAEDTGGHAMAAQLEGHPLPRIGLTGGVLFEHG